MPVRTVTLIPGDGTGPELTAAALRIIDASGAKLEWDVVEASDLERAVASIRKNRVALVGPARESIALYQALHIFLSIIPCRSMEGVPTQPPGLEIDVVVMIGRTWEDAGEKREVCAR